jgi:hypothetical protein
MAQRNVSELSEKPDSQVWGLRASGVHQPGGEDEHEVLKYICMVGGSKLTQAV